MAILIKIINILVLFNLGYWGFYFLVNLFYKIGKIELLVGYLIIGLIIGLFTTKKNISNKEKGSELTKEWTKLMNKCDSKNNPPKYIVIFIRMIGWPVGIIVAIKKFFEK